MFYEGNIFHGASLGISQPSGIQITDPLLSLAADGIKRPTSSSPTIDSAVGSYPDIISDIDGNTRPSNSADIGADEVSSTPSIHRRLNAESVGPFWTRPSQVYITGATSTLGGTEITFEDRTGLSPFYTLERSDDLTADSWTFVTTFVPTAHTSKVFTVTDPTTNQDKVFWRIKYLE